MIDSAIQRLLEQAIDSSIKLHMLLMYYENPRFEGTASQIAERLYRDIWSTREALSELAQDGILCAVGSSDPRYCYRPISELRESIFRLVQSYNEPLERDQLQRALREVASYAPYRRASHGAFTFDRQRI